jgi:hypothetical protein
METARALRCVMYMRDGQMGTRRFCSFVRSTSVCTCTAAEHCRLYTTCSIEVEPPSVVESRMLESRLNCLCQLSLRIRSYDIGALSIYCQS